VNPEPLKITDGQVGAEEPTEQEIEQARRNWDQMSAQDRAELEQIDREIEQSLYGEISEADFKAFEHPRGRGGKWIETLERPPAILDETHPSHDLAAGLIGQTMSEIRSGSMSLETAARGGHPMPLDFHYVSGDNRKQVFRSHTQGADLHLTLKGPGFGEAPGGTVADASAELHPPIPNSDPVAALLTHGDPQTVRNSMRGAGYSRPKVVNENGDDWMEFVHPNGQGRALRVDDTPGGVQVGKVSAFRPTDSEVASAKLAAIQENPFAHVKPGDNANTVVNALHTIDSGWRMKVSQNRGELSAGSLPEGVEGVTRFDKEVGPGQPPDSLVLHMRRGGNPSDPEYQRPLEIVNAGHGSMVWDHMIATPEQRADDVRVWQEAQDEIKRKREEAVQKDEAIKAALIGRDNKALLHELGNMDVYSATQLLTRLGAVKLPQEPGTTPTLSSTLVLPDRSTVKLTVEPQYIGGALRRAPNISKVEITPQDRTRLPHGQAPKNLDELLTDVLGRADELAKHYETEQNVKHVDAAQIPRNAAGVHRWNGSIGIKQRYLDNASDFLTTRAEGKQQTDNERLNFYNDLEILQHEINHGVGVLGGIQAQDYKGLGVNVEEALTEETGHLEVADWLRSYGMTDVLEAVKRHPMDYRVRGTYPKYRAQVGAIMRSAGLDEQQRRAKLRELKFQRATAEQHQELIALAQQSRPRVKTLRGALVHPDVQGILHSTFEPVVTPDLSDIKTEMPTVTTASGRKVQAGDQVKFALAGSGRQLDGTVFDVNENNALVVLKDGGRLWVAGDQIDQPSAPTPRPVTAEAPRVRSAEHHHAMTVADRWMQGQNIPAEQIDPIHRDVSNALGVMKISPAQAYLARLRDAASLGPLAGKGINVSDLGRTFKTEGLA
jgi:hypothetical protein